MSLMYLILKINSKRHKFDEKTGEIKAFITKGGRCPGWRGSGTACRPEHPRVSAPTPSRAQVPSQARSGASGGNRCCVSMRNYSALNTETYLPLELAHFPLLGTGDQEAGHAGDGRPVTRWPRFLTVTPCPPCSMGLR